MQAEQGNVNVNVVETSDAEEEEEMRASKYVYWKKEAKHETSDCDDHSPKKRLKVSRASRHLLFNNLKMLQLDHTYETVSETPSRGSPSPYLSPLPPSSQPLESVSSSPPFILPSSTPKSSSSVSTPPPPPPQSISEVWDENHDFYDDTLFQENSQDPLLLASQKSIRISKLEQKMLEFPPSPITSLYSNDSESHSRRSLVSSAYGTPTSSPAPTRSQSPVPTRLQSVDPLSLFNTPPPYQPPELPVAIVSPITNDVKMLLSPVQQPPSPHLSLSSSMAAPYLLRSPSQPPISPSPLTPPSPHTHGNVLDPLFDSSPSNTLSILPSPVEQNQEPTIAPLSELEIANMSDQPRYSLRRRGANQLKPYTIEKLQYKKALSSNPDAIVKFRSPTRGGHRHHYVDDVGGSQWEPYAADEDDPWEESQWLRSTENAQAGPSRLPASDKPDEDVRPSVQYSEFLQDLPTTDEEEAKELKALSKEARKAVRERRAKEAREAKEKLNRKKPKSFPLSKGHTVTDKPRPRTGSSHFDAVRFLRIYLLVLEKSDYHIRRTILQRIQNFRAALRPRKRSQIDLRPPSSSLVSLQTYFQTSRTIFVHFRPWSSPITTETMPRKPLKNPITSLWMVSNLHPILGRVIWTVDDSKALEMRLAMMVGLRFQTTRLIANA